jgi:prolyl oligopeptidase
MKIEPAIGILLAFSVLLRGQQAPSSPTDNFRESFHGRALVDPYHWLEDASSSATRTWIGAQNAYARSLLDPLPIRTAVSGQILGMLRHDQIGEPMLRNGYYYFTKRRAAQALPSFYRRRVSEPDDELLLDPDTLSKDHSTSISVFAVSDDGSMVAYGVRNGGQDETDLRILQVGSRHDLADHFPRALYRGFAFKKDGSGFYYTVEHRDSGQRLYYHVLGSEASKMWSCLVRELELTRGSSRKYRRTDAVY